MYLRANSTDLVILEFFSVLKHACVVFRVQLRARNASTKCYDLWELITKPLKKSTAAGIPFVIWILNVVGFQKRKHTNPGLLELCSKSWPRAEEIYFCGNWKVRRVLSNPRMTHGTPKAAWTMQLRLRDLWCSWRMISSLKTRNSTGSLNKTS